MKASTIHKRLEELEGLLNQATSTNPFDNGRYTYEEKITLSFNSFGDHVYELNVTDTTTGATFDVSNNRAWVELVKSSNTYASTKPALRFVEAQAPHQAVEA